MCNVPRAERLPLLTVKNAPEPQGKHTRLRLDRYLAAEDPSRPDLAVLHFSPRAPMPTLSARLLLALLLVGASLLPLPHAAHGQETTFRALVFSKTAGFRHASIPDGISALEEMADEHGLEVDATEDAGVFTDESLAAYDVVVFLNTTGDVLDAAQQAAFEAFVEGGGGFVGVHAAADTEYAWPFYGRLVGAYFESHPQVQEAVVQVLDRTHPSTEHLPARWTRTDEWYDYRANPRGEVHVLAALDAASYEGSTMGADHPIAWCHVVEGGRAWYTGGGHTSASFEEPAFRQHLLGGLAWAAGTQPGDCGATLGSNFERTILDDEAQNPMDLAVLPDGRVLYVERTGAVRLHDLATGVTSLPGQLDVTTAFEDGLLGVALAPEFEATGWLYLFYSPAGSEAKQHVSRFTLNGSTLDLASEQVLLEIPTQREECCHASGDLAVDPDGPDDPRAAAAGPRPRRPL